MRVLVISFFYTPDLSAGSFRASALVDRLIEKGCEVDVITTLPNRYFSYSREAREIESIKNLNIFRVKVPKHYSGMLDQIISFATFYFKAFKIAKSRKYNIVFATSSKLFTAFLGKQIAKKKGIPLYLDIRDIFVDTLEDILNKNIFLLIKPILFLIERNTFQQATKINIVSKGFEDYFKSKFNIKNLSYFTNGIDDVFLNQRNIKTNNNKIVICYAGNIGEGQGLHKIIPEFANSLKETHIFNIIGDGGMKNKFLESIQSVNNVNYISPINREDLILYYLKSDILFIHLNDYKAFKKVLPSKIFEYAALGKPLLAGVTGFSKNFINEHIENASTFIPCDHQGALEALKRLDLKHTERKEFKSNFDRLKIMNNMAEEIIEIIR